MPPFFSEITTTVTSLLRRNIQSDASNIKDTFSSWDRCMSKAYCKWPVIVAIIIASLIVLSLLLSIFRCCCLGVECCCGICACCNACCPSPRGSTKTKYIEAPQQPAPQYAYGHHAQMNYFPPAGPTTATFDAPSTRGTKSANIHADALPAMPSWDTSTSRRVEQDHDEELEAQPESKVINQSPLLQDGSHDFAMTRLMPRRQLLNSDAAPPPAALPMLYFSRQNETYYANQYGQGPSHSPHLQNRSRYERADSYGRRTPFQGGDLSSEYPRDEHQQPLMHHDSAYAGYNSGVSSPLPQSQPYMGYNRQMVSQLRPQLTPPHLAFRNTQTTFIPQELYSHQTGYAPRSQQAYPSYSSDYAYNLHSPQELDMGQASGHAGYSSGMDQPVSPQEMASETFRWGASDPAMARKPLQGSWREV